MSPDSPNDDATRTHLALTKGTSVQHYRIIEKIGAGGMGEVYLADDTKLGRHVALKFLPAQLALDADLRARFTREAQAAAKLSHPNIVTIYEVSEFNGRPFFAMEYVEGESLQDYAQSKNLSVDRILELAIQLCEGLTKAHQGGVTHRDIKSSNIVVDRDGRARILDFGLAQIEGDAALTKAGSTLGTVAYMSPEQVRGEQLDHRSDLFSLGVVLYELICGRAPFKRNNETATLQAILTEPPEPLTRYKAAVPDEFQRIIFKALEKDRALRYQTAADFLADLKREKRQLDSGESGAMSAMSVSRASAQPAPKRHWRFVLPISGLAVVVLVLLILKPWKLEIASTQDAQAANNWLAVMYFDNVADPTDAKKLGDISTNLLVTGLSQSQYIKVVSSQRLYDLLKQIGKEGSRTIDHATASDIAKKAQAHWMLTGSILQTEPKLVLTSQLIDVQSGGVIASQRATGETGEDIFAVIDKLSEQIKQSTALPSGTQTESPTQVSSVTTHSSESYRCYLEGIENTQKLYYLDAARSFRKAVQLDSTFAAAHLWLSRMGEGEESRQALRNAVKYADHASDRDRRRIEMERLGWSDSIDAVKAEIRDYLTRYSDDKEVYRNWGFVYYRVPPIKNDSAIFMFLKVLELDPSDRLASNQLSYLYGDSGDFSKAMLYFNKYAALTKNEANPHDTRGDLYGRQGYLDSALQSYRKALTIKPDFYQSLEKLGDCYLYSGDFTRAESCYQAYAVSDKSNQKYGRMDVSYIHAFKGHYWKAAAVLAQGIQANRLDGTPESDNVEARWGRILLFEALGACDSLTSELKQLMAIELPVEERPYDKRQHLQAYYPLLCGQTSESEQMLSKMKADSARLGMGRLLEYYYSAGLAALVSKDFPRAIEYLKRADGMQPSLVKKAYLGQTYTEAGDYRTAIATLEPLTKNYSEKRRDLFIQIFDAYYYLGRAYEMAGEKDKAIAACQDYIRFIDHPDAELKRLAEVRRRLAKLQS